jgi:uncharacterized protein (DUF342 family)
MSEKKENKIIAFIQRFLDFDGSKKKKKCKKLKDMLKELETAQINLQHDIQNESKEHKKKTKEERLHILKDEIKKAKELVRNCEQ